jgi:hypothetical protein
VYREALQRDHILPIWRGGMDVETNVQYLCANCHEDKTKNEQRSTEWAQHQRERRRLQPAPMLGFRHTLSTIKKMKESKLGERNAMFGVVSRMRGEHFKNEIKERSAINIARRNLIKYQAWYHLVED